MDGKAGCAARNHDQNGTDERARHGNGPPCIDRKYRRIGGWTIEGRAKGALGCWIVCAEWAEIDHEWQRIDVKCAKVDGEIIKPDTWYSLKNGAFEEVKADA